MTLRNEYLLGKIGDYAADHKEVDMLVSGTNRQVRYYLHCHTSHLVVFVNINLAQANKLYRGHTSLVTGYWLLVTGYWLLVTGYWLLGTMDPFHCTLELNISKIS